MTSLRTLLPLNVDFAAKVRWRMRFDRNPLLITLQDKYALREYADSRGVKTPRLLHLTDCPETIPFDDLPLRYMIKATHGRAWNILCFDSELYPFGDGCNLINQDGSLLNTEAAAKYKLSRSEAVKLCKYWLAQKYNSREWAYQFIYPRILVEELLVPKDNTILKDYRMYTFRGAVKAINVGSALYRKTHTNVFFDAHWKEFKLTKYREQIPCPLPEVPEVLGDMIKVAEKIGHDMDFTRIDLYDTPQGIFLGEATVYPEGGGLDSPTSCPAFNKWLGNQWALNKIDSINAAWWGPISGMWWCARQINTRTLKRILGNKIEAQPPHR